MLCCWIEDPNSNAFKCHLPRLHDYLWVAEDGMKVQVQKHSFYHSDFIWLIKERYNLGLN